MASVINRNIVPWGLSLLMIAMVIGCNDHSIPSLADVNNTNIKKLRGAYGLYLVNHNMAGPDNEENFKQYLKNDPGAKMKLARMEVTPETVDDIFISERDGKPFKIKYGLKGLSNHAMIFEAEGVDGKREVAFFQPKEVDAAEYDQLWNAKPSKKSAEAQEDFANIYN